MNDLTHFVNKRILLIDGDHRVRTLLRNYLEKENFIVEEAASGVQAIRQYYVHGNFDLIVLDCELPDISGLEICKYVKHSGDVPVVILSERAEEGDRIEGFRAGADDYVVKPFSPREVLLRIQSIVARMTGACISQVNDTSSSEILIAGIRIQPSARRIRVQGNEIHLTRKEYDLLYLLVTNPEKVFSREELLREVWKSPVYDQRTVDTHIKRLREKLTFHYPEGNEFIQTLWGLGYMFRSPEQSLS
ncbi:response regulator transcription factor [Bacillus sp. FJAT-27264]|uniref:response regulator transcription factor n=1 Tax=Paenibacillus sp. (strain DSM 101736 / FJAT-27264) TaxID=1850362 RepID=UPI0009F54B27|nr:response regulator transcription factor [Bacillus sp. FJAT-27264]